MLRTAVCLHSQGKHRYSGGHRNSRERASPHIISNENASQDELDEAFTTVSIYQEKFLNAWNKVHTKP